MSGRNIVICLDGTANEPERSLSNVLRTFDIAEQCDSQIVYYDPGVGTLGARNRTGRVGKAASRVGGLAFGHGIQENIEEAYQFLMRTYEKGDRIFLFGFSRGAYTARALAGLLRSVGLIRPELATMLPYAMKLYTRKTTTGSSAADTSEYWSKFNHFQRTFCRPDFPSPFETEARQIHFLGIWDTVKFVGWFNFKGQFQQARWPFTRNLTNVTTGRHALALDERRRYYSHYRFDPTEVAKADRDLSETWFVGAHSDVGGGLNDPQPLADVTLAWMLSEAAEHGLIVNTRCYKRELGVKPGEPLPAFTSDMEVSANKRVWWFAGAGWQNRSPSATDTEHKSVAAWKQSHPSYRE